MTVQPSLAPSLRARLERLAGSRVTDAAPALGGYTPAERWVLTFESGSRAFAKTGVDSPTSLPATWLRQEHRAYSDIGGPFMPRLLGWEDDPAQPLLLLEDLSSARWPPPWDRRLLDEVLETIDAVAATPVPSWAPELEAREREHLSGWARVREDPQPFLELGLASGEWLAACLNALIASSSSAVLDGDDIVHFDVRSDNLCFDGERVRFIDWNHVARGNADIDRVALLSCAHAEGAPQPWTMLADTGGVAALLAGYFASRTGLPPIPTAPRVREVQFLQPRPALEWARRELHLPPLDGTRRLSTHAHEV